MFLHYFFLQIPDVSDPLNLISDLTSLDLNSTVIKVTPSFSSTIILSSIYSKCQCNKMGCPWEEQDKMVTSTIIGHCLESFRSWTDEPYLYETCPMSSKGIKSVNLGKWQMYLLGALSFVQQFGVMFYLTDILRSELCLYVSSSVSNCISFACRLEISLKKYHRMSLIKPKRRYLVSNPIIESMIIFISHIILWFPKACRCTKLFT